MEQRQWGYSATRAQPFLDILCASHKVSIQGAARASGIPVRTIWYWYATQPLFQRRVREAQAAALLRK